MRQVLIAAGGTGGHIFPALVVADRLRQEGIKIHWVGSSREIEQRLVAPHYPLDCLSIEALRGRGMMNKLLLPWRLCKSLWQCCRIMIKVKPDVVLTMGSFVSAPVGLAAWLWRKPLIVHEQNSIAGLANHWLSKLAVKTLEAFPHSFKDNHGAILVGNPVREHFFDVPPPQQRLKERSGLLRVLIFGGSQGAHAINIVVAEWLEQYARVDQVEVWHQCGSADLAALQQRYDGLDLSIKLMPFIDDMANAYAWADLVVSRAGALSVAEIAAVGVASILVPFPYAVDNHQLHNAEYLSHSGAAIVIDQKQLTPQWLSQKIDHFYANRAILLDMAASAKNNARITATSDLVQVLQEAVARSKR